MSDPAAALEEKIHRTIPLSAAMGYRIAALGHDHIVVEAPLEPNVNIHGTGFAGSIYALGALTAWALGNHVIGEAGLDAELVIAKATIRYRRPIRDAIRCSCRLGAGQAAVFTATLRDSGRARTEVEVEIGDGPAARLQATLHASRERAPAR